MGKEKKETVWVYGSEFGWVRLKHAGLYDLDTLLGAAKSWFMSKKYFIQEAEHTEAVKGGGKEIVFLWQPFRDVTDYVRFKFEFQVIIYREVDVVVESDGKKVKMQQGDIEVRFRNSMVKNYRQTFRGPGKEFMRQTYEKYLIRRELDDYQNKLTGEGAEFWDVIKGVLGGFKR